MGAERPRPVAFGGVAWHVLAVDGRDQPAWSGGVEHRFKNSIRSRIGHDAGTIRLIELFFFVLASDLRSPFSTEQLEHFVDLGCLVIPRRGQFGSWDWSSAITNIDFYRGHILSDPAIAEDAYIQDHDDDVVFLNDRILAELDGSDFLGLPNTTPIPSVRCLRRHCLGLRVPRSDLYKLLLGSDECLNYFRVEMRAGVFQDHRLSDLVGERRLVHALGCEGVVDVGERRDAAAERDRSSP